MKHTVTDRGFKHMEAVAGSYPNDEVRVYESSSAEGAYLWLNVRDSQGKAAAHLTLEQAAVVVEQLQWLIANHFKVEETS